MYLSPQDIDDAARLHELDPQIYTPLKLGHMFRVPEAFIESALGAKAAGQSNVSVTVNSIETECGWTPARVDLAKDLWLSGHSAKQIADKLHTSRNACISKLHRMGLSGGGTAQKRVTRYGRVAMAAILLESRRRSPGLVEKVDPDGGAPGMRKLPLVQLTRHQCHWPYNDPKKPDFYYCGADIEDEGKSYCRFHIKRGFRPEG